MYFKLTALALVASVQSFMPSPQFGLHRTAAVFSTAADEFIRKSTEMAESKPEDEVPKLFSEDLLEDMRNCLLTLEKRVRDGPGSLTHAEVDAFAIAAGRVMVDMKEQGAALDRRVKPGERQAKAERIAADAAIRAEKQGKSPAEIEAVAKQAFGDALAAMIPPPGAESGPPPAAAQPARPAARAGPAPLVTELGASTSQVPFTNLSDLASRSSNSGQSSSFDMNTSRSMSIEPTAPMGYMESLAPPSPMAELRSATVAPPTKPMQSKPSFPQVHPSPIGNMGASSPPVSSGRAESSAPPAPTGRAENLNDEPDFDGKSIGLSRGTANTYAIPGMEEMTPEEYQKALADTVIERSREQRFTGRARGNSLTHDYMAHLSGGRDVNIFGQNKKVDEN